MNGIKQLLHMCPLDKMTTSGTLFWSGAKKPPAVVEFDISDALHLEFIVSLASLRAAVYRIPVTEAELDPAALAAVCSRAVLPVFRPSSTTVVATTEEKQKQQQQQLSQMVDIDSEFARLLR